MNLTSAETRVFVLMQYPSVTDGQTDGHTSPLWRNACIAHYATALVTLATRFKPNQHTKNGATMCDILTLKCTKFDFR